MKFQEATDLILEQKVSAFMKDIKKTIQTAFPEAKKVTVSLNRQFDDIRINFGLKDTTKNEPLFHEIGIEHPERLGEIISGQPLPNQMKITTHTTSRNIGKVFPDSISSDRNMDAKSMLSHIKNYFTKLRDFAIKNWSKFHDPRSRISQQLIK